MVDKSFQFVLYNNYVQRVIEKLFTRNRETSDKSRKIRKKGETVMQKSIVESKQAELDSYLVNRYALKDEEFKYKFSEGKKTDVIEGIKYTLVNVVSLDTINVTVKKTIFLISKEELLMRQNQSELVLVTLVNAKIKAYYSTFTNCICDIIIADDIKLITEK